MKIDFNRILKISLLLLVLQLTVCAESISNKNYGSAVVSEVTSIYDGDTFRVNLKGYPEIIGNRIGIRINGIDTPEMRARCEEEKSLARQAKEFAVTQLRRANKVELRNMKRGKYFRIVADVYVDGKDLGTMLVDNGLAVSYDGGHKAKDWCR
jgi:endonuclease YncB( thermonuclease family)